MTLCSVLKPDISCPWSPRPPTLLSHSFALPDGTCCRRNTTCFLGTHPRHWHISRCNQSCADTPNNAPPSQPCHSQPYPATPTPQPFGEPDSGNIHRWRFFVTFGSRHEDASYIESVTVRLHPTFRPSVLEFTEPPFSVSRVRSFTGGCARGAGPGRYHV